jgi:hypothetical protein
MNAVKTTVLIAAIAMAATAHSVTFTDSSDKTSAPSNQQSDRAAKASEAKLRIVQSER